MSSNARTVELEGPRSLHANQLSKGTLYTGSNEVAIKAHLGPKAVGERAQGKILARLMEYNFTILIPFGDSARYDLVIEKEGNFWRVQCKTGRIRNLARLGGLEPST